MNAAPNGKSEPEDHDLTRENAKLRKINQVLMTRVERSMDMQGSDFSLFEHATLLESRVRERTDELESVLHQDLARTKAEAERANSSKTRFLAAASHDLLQPLNAARLFVAALAETNQDDRNRTIIDSIETAFASVEELLTDLLEISKLDAGAQRVDMTAFSLTNLLESLSAEFKPMAMEKGLGFDCSSTRSVLFSDRQLLGRVLRNLIGNAIRYTDRGRVMIRSETVRNRCCITIFDTGRGIPLEQQNEIFEEFKRLEQGNGHHQHGHGLGLAIVQRILTLLDHPIELNSTPDKGSSFSILVPLAGTEKTAGIDAGRSSGEQAVQAWGTVLVIENEEAIRTGMTVLLESWGYRALTAATAEDAIAAFAAQSSMPDLIIADYHLDQGHLGTEAIAHIQTAYGTSIPALIITADRSPEVRDAIAGRKLPLLTKPIKPARLRALINYMITT